MCANLHNWKRKETSKSLDPQTAHVTGHLNQVGSKVSIDQKTTDPQFPGLQLLLGGAALDQLGCRGEMGIPRLPCPPLRAPGQPVSLGAWAPPSSHWAHGPSSVPRAQVLPPTGGISHSGHQAEAPQEVSLSECCRLEASGRTSGPRGVWCPENDFSRRFLTRLSTSCPVRL